jgi:hypothetical protein
LLAVENLSLILSEETVISRMKIWVLLVKGTYLTIISKTTKSVVHMKMLQTVWEVEVRMFLRMKADKMELIPLER